MATVERVDDILAQIDAVVPPTEHPFMEEVHGLIAPQLEMIVALSGMERVFDERNGKDRNFMDTHHLFFPRADYRTGLQKIFRKVFVLPIHRGIHDELHSRIEPPAMPPKAVMLGYLSLLDQKEHRKVV